MLLLKKLIFALFLFLAVYPRAFAADEIRVVTTTKTFADIVKQVGSERVKVDYVAPPGQNIHFIQPRPSTIVKLIKADLFIHAGLDLEAWRGPFVEAAGKSKFLPGGDAELDLSNGIRLLEIPQGQVTRAEGDMHLFGNPHYWTDPRNGKIMARTVYQKLSEMYPEYENEFRKNLEQFLSKLDKKIIEWQNCLKPLHGGRIVTYHNSWPYFADFAGVEIADHIETRPGIPPTIRHIAKLIKLMRDEKVKVIVHESYFEKTTPKKLAKQTGARVIELASSVGENKDAKDYFAMFNYNVNTLSEALKAGNNV